MTDRWTIYVCPDHGGIADYGVECCDDHDRAELHDQPVVVVRLEDAQKLADALNGLVESYDQAVREADLTLGKEDEVLGYGLRDLPQWDRARAALDEWKGET